MIQISEKMISIWGFTISLLGMIFGAAVTYKADRDAGKIRALLILEEQNMFNNPNLTTDKKRLHHD